MKYFVVVYDRDTGKAKIQAAYGATRRSQAMAERFRLEERYANRSEMEVVVLGAESEDALARTHARYFRSSADLLRRARAAHA